MAKYRCVYKSAKKGPFVPAPGIRIFSDNHRAVYVGTLLAEIPSLLWDFKCGLVVYNRDELCFSTFVVH